MRWVREIQGNQKTIESTKGHGFCGIPVLTFAHSRQPGFCGIPVLTFAHSRQPEFETETYHKENSKG